MKELKSKVIDIRAKRRLKAAASQTSLIDCDFLPTEPIPKATITIEPLQPQSMREQPDNKQTDWQQLTAQAERINHLSAELEVAMFELKAIASDINCRRRIKHNRRKPPKSVCEYLSTVVPYVTHKQSGTFVLTNRSVDLFRAEREATQVAKTLRRQAKRKKVVSPPRRRNKCQLLGWLT